MNENIGSHRTKVTADHGTYVPEMTNQTIFSLSKNDTSSIQLSKTPQLQNQDPETPIVFLTNSRDQRNLSENYMDNYKPTENSRSTISTKDGSLDTTNYGFYEQQTALNNSKNKNIIMAENKKNTTNEDINDVMVFNSNTNRSMERVAGASTAGDKIKKKNNKKMKEIVPEKNDSKNSNHDIPVVFLGEHPVTKSQGKKTI